MDIDRLTERVKRRLRDEEGLKLSPYPDTEGLLTIGYGWCLQRSPMRVVEAEFRLTNDVSQELSECIRYVPGFAEMSEARQEVFVDMTHQMGIQGVMGFRRMIGAVRIGDWERASEELLDSKYAKEQAPARAARNARLLRDGE